MPEPVISVDEARNALVAYSKRLVADGLCIGTSGNISVRVGDRIFITPSSVPADQLTPEMIAETDLSGEVVSASARPSTELPLHTVVYNSSSAKAVVHTHSRFATTLSATVNVLPAVHYMVNSLGGPIRVAPYVTFGTRELAQVVQAALEGRSAAILQNHGAVTYGSNLEDAYQRSVLLEWLSELYFHALQVGPPRILSQEELQAVIDNGRRLKIAYGGVQ